MPLFKTNDFWMPNTFYYATERYKSVIEYNNQLYVCTDTHKSEDTFNTSKFNTLGGGGGLIEQEWDIEESTIIEPPAQINVKLNDTLDSTFSEINNTYTITKNSTLTEYPMEGGGYLFGGSKNNIDVLDNEYKEIIIKDFSTLTNDYIILLFSSLSFDDILPVLSNATNILQFTFITFGNTRQIIVKLNDDNSTIYNNIYTINTTELFDIKVRVNENVIQVFLNDTIVIDKSFINEPIETWQTYLNGDINMFLLSAKINNMISRNSIIYEMPLPFTVEETVTTVNPPDNASDGSLYKLISNGNYNGNNLYTNDRIIFQNNLQEVIIIPDNIKKIPILELEIFKNRIYERGIIDEVLSTLPGNVDNLPNFYTFWVIDTSTLYAITETKQLIIIDILDNTFRIMDSGLILERNDTGMYNPSESIEIIDNVNYSFLNDMINNLHSIGLQISEENAYKKRIKNVILNETNTYVELYLGENIGNYNYIFNDESISTATLVISPNAYNQITDAAYNSIKESIVTIENLSYSNKTLIISNTNVANISSNNISLKPSSKILLELKSSYNNDIIELIYTICTIKNVESLNRTLYVEDEPSYNFSNHIDYIIINSSLPTVVITGVTNTNNTHKYKIYNNGNTVDVNLTINGTLYSFNLPSNHSREILILEQNAPIAFNTGVVYQ